MTVWNRKVFGSGTRLYVTDSGQDKPDVSLTAFPPSNEKGNKRTMVCQAEGRLLDVVEFLWESKSSSGDWTGVSKDHVVEQRDKNEMEFVTSMVIVDKNAAKDNKYRCSVKYEESNVASAEIIDKSKDKRSQDDKSKDDTPNPTCPPTEEKSQKQKSGTVDETHSLYLFIYAYGLMLMKNGVYFCAILVYLLKRKAGKKKDENS